MLHQIRKMIGLAISIFKGYVEENIFEKVWKNERIDIPIAPGVGLVLEEPHYLYYNKKYYNDGIHEVSFFLEYCNFLFINNIVNFY